MGIFDDEAERLLRRQWSGDTGATDLAQELYSIFTSKGPIQISSPLQIKTDSPEAALSITNNFGDGSGIGLNINGGQIINGDTVYGGSVFTYTPATSTSPARSTRSTSRPTTSPSSPGQHQLTVGSLGFQPSRPDRRRPSYDARSQRPLTAGRFGTGLPPPSDWPTEQRISGGRQQRVVHGQGRLRDRGRTTAVTLYPQGFDQPAGPTVDREVLQPGVRSVHPGRVGDHRHPPHGAARGRRRPHGGRREVLGLDPGVARMTLGKLPIGPGPRLMLSRGQFLSGDQATYFGPRQRPDSWPGLGRINYDDPSWSAGSAESVGYRATSAHDYIPPEEWPAAGTLLYIPQVVHLTAYLTYKNRVYTGFDDSVHGWPGDPNVLAQDEYDRLNAAFESAKATIEGLRPNRTWVEINLWQRTFTSSLDGNTKQWDDLYEDTQVLPILAPPSEAEPYFGLNYLHLYAGNYVFDNTFVSGGDTLATRNEWWHVSYNPPGDTFSEENLADQIADLEAGAEFAAGIARLQAAYPNFVGYRTRLYAPDLTEFIPNDPEDPFMWNGQPLSVDSVTSDAIANEKIAQALLASLAGSLGDQGVTYHGDTSGLDAGSIVSLIAAHFGFDPSTGRDL
jgi:hypothetical protein